MNVAGGNVNGTAAVENSVAVPQKIKHGISIQSSNLLLEINTKN